MNIRSDIEFIQVTDPHIESEGSAHWEMDTYESCGRVLSTAKARHPALHFIVFTGDLVDIPNADAYRRFAHLVKSFPLPIYRIPGNHDDVVMVEAYLSSPPFYSSKRIELPGWQLIFLNSSGPDHHSGHLTDKELNRLRHALQDSKDHALIFIHHPPIPIGSAWMDAMGLDNAEDFRAIAEAHATQVKAVAFGHVHQEFQHARNGVLYLGTPSTCVQFVPGCAEFAKSELAPGYRWFRLKPDGSYETRVYYLDQPILKTEPMKITLAR